MSINGRLKDFTRTGLLALANRFGVGTGAQVIDQVITSISLWPTFADEARVPKPVAVSIANLHLLDMGKA